MNQGVAEFEKLLDDFKKVYDPNKPQYEPSYLEICDYPGRRTEEIWSKLLAFFFDTNNPHGMGSLFIDSLIDVYTEKKKCDGPKFQTNIIAETEVHTDEKNRIDILLKCNDLVVCIENKIWAYLDNDLDDYYIYTEKKFVDPSKTESLYIILSVREDMESILNNRIKNEELKYGSKYEVVYYRKFLEKLKINLGQVVTLCNHKYLSILTDWIQFVEKTGGYMSDFSKEEEDFFKKNDIILQDLFNKRNDFLKEKKSKNAGIIQKIQSDLNAKQKNVWWVYDQTDLGCTFKENDNNYEIGIESGFDINDNFRIQITIWQPNKSNRRKIVNNYEKYLKALFEKTGCFNKDGSKWEMEIEYLKEAPNDEKIKQTLIDIYEKVNQLVNQISTKI